MNVVQSDSDALMAVDLELEDREPFDLLEHEGLTVRFYELDGQLVLDFDYDPEGVWAYLEEPEALKAFAQQLLDRLGDEPQDPVAAGSEAGPGCASGACPLPGGA